MGPDKIESGSILSRKNVGREGTLYVLDGLGDVDQENDGLLPVNSHWGWEAAYFTSSKCAL